MTNTEVPGGHQWASPSADGFVSPASTAPEAPIHRPAPPAPTPALTYRSWQPGIVALRPLSFGDFLVAPFKAMRFNRGVMVGAPVLLSSASALLTVLAVWVAIKDPKLDLASSNGGWTGVTVPTVVLAILAVLAWIATDLLASAVVIPGVARAFLGERITIKQALATVRPRIGALVVIDLILIGIIGVYSAIIALGFVGLVAADSSGGLATVGTILGQWLFLPIAAALGVYLPSVKGAMILEGTGPIRSIRRSIKLVPGRFWWTILILLVVRTAIYFIEQVALGIGFFAGLMLAFTPDSSVVLYLVLAIFVAVALIVIAVIEYSLAGGVNALLYLDLRMRKEGLAFDLAKAAEAKHSARQRVIG